MAELRPTISVQDASLESIFKDTETGKHYRRVKGDFAPAGLRIGLLPTTMIVGDTATALPITPLTNRNSMIIFNHSTTVSLFIGNADVTADSVIGITSGWEIAPRSYFATDIQTTIIIYGICPIGETAKIQILEVA